MSKHNRDRRRAKWRCCRCGAPMHSELHSQSRNRLRPGAKVTDVIHICGACEAFHCTEDGVRLRLLTPAEEFALRFEMPRATEGVSEGCRLVNEPDFPGLGLLTIAKE